LFYFFTSNIIIYDEYHTLTNNASKKDQKYREAIMKLPCGLKIGLTATPFVNNEMEAVLAFGLLNNIDLIEKFHLADLANRKLMVQKVKETQFLFYRMNPYNLPLVSEWLISIPMGKEHYDQYLSVKKEYGSENMASRHRVGKLSVSSALVDNKKNKLNLNLKIETGKIKALRGIISHLPDGDKIVICDNYKETLEYIMQLDFMEPLNPLLFVGGSSPSSNKDNSVSFINKPECRALLTTRQKGGEGVNLQAANHIVLINFWYTVKEVVQIIGRIKRKGQRKPVYAYILGYNLLDCLESGMASESYILKEDEDFYRIIRKKMEIYEEWGMSVKTKMPPLQEFFNFSSFENDFSNFLEQILGKNPLIKGFNERNEVVDNQEEEHDEEIEKSYLSQLISRYMKRLPAPDDIKEHGEEEEPDLEEDKIETLGPASVKGNYKGTGSNVVDNPHQEQTYPENQSQRRKIIVVKKKKPESKPITPISPKPIDADAEQNLNNDG
jgi:superfamily II DNA or RNA helicase